MFFSELKKNIKKKTNYSIVFSSRCWNQVLFCMPIKTGGSTPKNIYIPYFHCRLKAVDGTIFCQSAPLVGILVIWRPWIAADVEAETTSQSTVQVSRVGRAKWQAQNAEPLCPSTIYTCRYLGAIVPSLWHLAPPALLTSPLLNQKRKIILAH
jgi:hypothetical protein